MNTKKTKLNIILAGQVAVDELIKVAKEPIVDEERLYCMKSNDIVIKYENEGNEVEYNPRWAGSS